MTQCPHDGKPLFDSNIEHTAPDHIRKRCGAGHVWWHCPGNKGTPAHTYCQQGWLQE